MISSVGFIGSGNVATHLSLALQQAGFDVSFIYSKTPLNTEKLANKLNCTALKNLNQVPIVDLIFLCVKDDTINEIGNLLKNSQALVVHTSGAADINELKLPNRTGVLYPFQSISKELTINWKNIPLLIETNNSQDLNALKQLSETLSSNVIEANSDQRKHLHLTGVLVNNFVNHLAVLGFDLLSTKQLDSNLLLPLIEETTRKILLGNPRQYQTGPAVRNDGKTIKTHQDLLKNNLELLAIYDALTKSIKSNN